MLFTMWFPDEALENSILAGLSLNYRRPPFMGPYLQCTFSMQHQFVCDTIATTTSLSSLGPHQFQYEDDHSDAESDVLDTSRKKLPPGEDILQTKCKAYDSDQKKVATWSAPLANVTSRHLLAFPLLQWLLEIMPRSGFSNYVSFFTHPYLLLTYLTILSFAAYWPSLWAELVFDDRPAIIENKDLHWNSPWSQLWFNDYWGTPLKSPLSHKSYRPLTVASFRLNYLIHQLHPFGYHLVNVLLHSFVSILFYRFCLFFFNETPSKSTVNKSGKIKDCATSRVTTSESALTRNRLSPCSTSFLIALLFCAHPIHTDSVSSVVGRAELLSAIFYLAAILVWTTSKAEAVDWKSFRTLQLLLEHKRKLAAISLALGGFLCKEQSILALVYLCLYELNPFKGTKREPAKILVEGRPITQAYWGPVRRRSTSSSRPLFLLLLLLSLLTALYFRFALMNHSLPTFGRFDNPASRLTFPSKHLNYMVYSLLHFWLLLVPVALSCDHTHSSIELIDFSERHLSWHLFCALGALLSLTALGVLLLRQAYLALAPMRVPFLCKLRPLSGDHSKETSQKTLHAFALTLLPFLPASNLFFPTGFVIAERVLYLPSVGFLLLLGLGVRQLTAKWPARQFSVHPVHLVLIALLTVFSFKTYSRSLDWSNEYRLYKSGLEVYRHNTKLMLSLGRLYEKDNQLETAIQLYERAIRIEPTDIRSHLNLGNALLVKKDIKRAEAVYKEALNQVEEELFAQTDVSLQLSRNPTLSPLYLTALVRLAELINQFPPGPSLRANDLEQIKQKMATLHFLTSHGKSETPEDSRAQWSSTCGLRCPSSHPDRSIELKHLYNMAVLQYRQGHYRQSLDYFDQVLSLDPTHRETLLASAQIIEKENLEHLNPLALARLNQLVDLGTDDATVYFSLAMLAAKANKHTQARDHLLQAISRQPAFVEARYNLALLLVRELEFLGKDPEKRRSNVQQALVHLERVNAITQCKHVKSMLLLGDLYAELHQVDTARRYYQLVIQRVQPNHLQARYNLCVLWHKQRDLQETIRCFERLKEDLQTNSQMENDIARIEKQLELLRSVQPRRPSPVRQPNKLIKWPKRHFPLNESSQMAEEKRPYFRDLMSALQLPTMCFI